MNTSVGINAIHFYTGNFVFSLQTLAEAKNIDANKYTRGIGQDHMSLSAHDEDVVTLGANAAYPLVKDDNSNISTLLFATETGVDQSKSAGVYVHRLLDLPKTCRIVELKQACYSGTAAVQMACALVARKQNERVLVIMSDIAHYDLNTPAEATQGCGAVAMMITANPRVAEVLPESGLYTEDVMDFWRPNYRKNALVDGKFSAEMYMKSLTHAWDDYVSQTDSGLGDFRHFCYHSPFSRMAFKAHLHLARHCGVKLSGDNISKHIDAGLHYNRTIGNSYTASLYIGLTSLLEHVDGLAGQRIGMFSYGSGCVGEFFALRVVDNYEEHLFKAEHRDMLDARTAIDHSQYLHYCAEPEPTDGEAHEMEMGTTGRFRLAAINAHQREYVIV